jgi:hypothetical protein
MNKLDPAAIAQRLANNLTPTQLLEVWFHLTGVLRMAYQVEAEPLIECVRGSTQHADGTTEYAFAAITRREPVKVNLRDMPPDMARQKTPQG